MYSLTYLVIIISTIYLSMSLLRLYQYSRESGLLSSHLNTRLCLIGFCSGLTYFAGNYEVQRFLHEYIKVIPVPIAPLLWIFAGVIGTSYLYIGAVNRYTVFNISKWISDLLIVGVALLVVANFILYKQMPFYRLQVIDGLIGSVLCIIAAVSVAPMMRTVLSSDHGNLHRGQFLLTLLQLLSASMTAVLLVADSVYKLWFDISLIYTPLYLASVTFHTIQILVMQMMNEGIGIHWINYPFKLRYYFKLKQLYRTVQNMVQAPDPYNIPLPTIPLPHSIDTMTYRVFIMITDRYWRIEKSEPLRQRIERVLTLDIPPDIMLQQLGEVKKDKR